MYKCLLPFLAIVIVLAFMVGLFTLLDILMTEKWEDYFIYPIYHKWFENLEDKNEKTR